MVYLQKRHSYWISVMVMTFLFTAISPFLGMGKDLERIVALAYALSGGALCYQIAYEDAAYHGDRLPGKGARWAFLLVTIIAVPYYLYRTRSWRKATLLFVAFASLWFVLSFSGAIAGIVVFTYFGGNIDALP